MKTSYSHFLIEVFSELYKEGTEREREGCGMNLKVLLINILSYFIIALFYFPDIIFWIEIGSEETQKGTAVLA